MRTIAAFLLCVLTALCSRPCGAGAQPRPTPCGTPGSAPQLPIMLGNTKKTEGQLQLELVSREGDFQQRLQRFLFVPADGQIAVAQIRPGDISVVSEERHNDIDVFVATVTVSKPPPGNYRVVLQERDIAAPANCPLEFFQGLGSVNVGAFK